MFKRLRRRKAVEKSEQPDIDRRPFFFRMDITGKDWLTLFLFVASAALALAFWAVDLLDRINPQLLGPTTLALMVLPFFFLYSLLLAVVQSNSFRFCLYSLISAGAFVIFSYATLYSHYGVNTIGCEEEAHELYLVQHIPELSALEPEKRPPTIHDTQSFVEQVFADLEDAVVAQERCKQTTKLTGLYFSVITWSTLGYGDIAPSESTRVFVSIQALIGLLVTGLFVGIMTSAIIHRWTGVNREMVQNV